MFLDSDTESRKLSESVYKLFYATLTLPIESKDRKNLVDQNYIIFS
jgi:hypothetical protein